MSLKILGNNIFLTILLLKAYQYAINQFFYYKLENCVDNVERTYEKFTSTLRASLVQGGEGAEE